ncbi:putative G-protein coupled receptor 33 [Carettochelys insculpta]|uniref:putative G-protein coupled receptor 33 n=1 Tax=Carettochelys insculpta TaxID=44489 RepID=UPI003EBD4479
MEQDTSTFPPSPEPNSTQTQAAVSAPHLAVAVLLFTIFLLGVMGNGLYLWVLVMKMRRTVTTLWFLHLVSCYLLFALLIPFFAIYVLLGFHWVFSTAMCKLLNACISLGMFSSIFLLTLISLDRYTLTHHPLRCWTHRTVPPARKLVVGVWLVSIALSAPYLAFRETREVGGGRIICMNNYVLSRERNGTGMQDMGRQVQLAVFVIQFLVGFLLPFCTIAGCYRRVGLMMKEKDVAWAGKPSKVLLAVVLSFFLGWLPYHLYHGWELYEGKVPEPVMGARLVIYTFTSFFNACFAPILYLFVGEKFWQVFRLSLLTLVKAAFVDELGISGPELSGRMHDRS